VDCGLNVCIDNSEDERNNFMIREVKQDIKSWATFSKPGGTTEHPNLCLSVLISKYGNKKQFTIVICGLKAKKGHP
jgi:hypothetical protein